MKVKYTPQSSQVYVKHYMRGGSEIGSYFKATPILYGSGLSGLLATITKYAVPLFKQSILPAIKNITKDTLTKAIPMIKKEGQSALNNSLKEVSNVLLKKKSGKQAWTDSKSKIRKRVAEMIDDNLSESKRAKRSDIFKSP